jgi:glycosyltransferase involved in cell wall biosynthesis
VNKRRVLYVAHNHPRLRPGGAEAYALELYEAMRDRSKGFEPIFLAAAQPQAVKNLVPPRRDTAFAPVTTDDPRQYYFINDPVHVDWFLCTAKHKDVATKHFRDFLLATRPDVVHFQHTLFLGYELIRVARQTLPDCAIVYTLHEYLPICHHHGQMSRTFDRSPCTHASAHRCHQCYPKIAPEQFFLRKQITQAHFAHVDLFLAPSEFLLEKYVQWGIPREKIRLEDYGRRPAARAPETGDRTRRDRFGFFGQFTPFKGADVLLEAMARLASSREGIAAHLWLHGANLEYQPREFQKRFNDLLQRGATNVAMVGKYAHDQLPALLAEVDWVIVPSIWWENSPLVIQEAFMHGRPVICSDIGGMAEKVADGVNGLHFRAGDAASLADVVARAATTPGLWERLARGIPFVYDIAAQVGVLESVYDELLRREPAGVSA